MLIQILDRCTQQRGIKKDQQIMVKLIKNVVDSHNSMVNLFKQRDYKKANQTTISKILELIGSKLKISIRLRSLILNLLQKKNKSIKSQIQLIESPMTLQRVHSQQQVKQYLNNYSLKIEHHSALKIEQQQNINQHLKQIFKTNQFSEIKLRIIKALQNFPQCHVIEYILLSFYDGKLIEIRVRLDVIIDLMDRGLLNCKQVVNCLKNKFELLVEQMIDFPGLKSELRKIFDQLKRLNQQIPKQWIQFYGDS